MRLKSAHERRLTGRRLWKSKIVLEDEFGEGLVYLYSHDISLGGLFLKNPPPLKMGAHLFLSFVLPGKKRSIRLTGQVVRFASQKGAGIRFVDVDAKTFKMLERALKDRKNV